MKTSAVFTIPGCYHASGRNCCNQAIALKTPPMSVMGILRQISPKFVLVPNPSGVTIDPATLGGVGLEAVV